MINHILRCTWCSSLRLSSFRSLSVVSIRNNLGWKGMDATIQSNDISDMGNVNKPKLSMDKKHYVTRRDVSDEVKDQRGNSVQYKHLIVCY